MQFLNFLCLLLGILLFVNGVSSISKHTDKEKKIEGNSDIHEKWNWQDTVSLVSAFLSMAFLIFVLFWGKYYLHIEEFRWFFLICTFVVLLRQSADTLIGVDNFRYMLNVRANGKLDKKEKVILLIFASTCCFFYTYGLPKQVVSVARNCNDENIADWLMLAFFVFSISITIFLICSLAITPLQTLASMTQRLVAKFDFDKLSRFEKKTKRLIYGPLQSRKNLTITLANCIMRKPVILRCLLCILLPAVFVIDILWGSISFLITTVLELFWYMYVFLKQCSKIVYHAGTFITTISEKRVVAFSFRLAIILGLGCTVFLIYYDPFLINMDRNGTVFEFVASSIIIPVVFEWVWLYRQSVASKHNKDE